MLPCLFKLPMDMILHMRCQVPALKLCFKRKVYHNTQRKYQVLLLFFFLLLFITVLSYWDFSQGKFGLLSIVKASCDILMPPTYSACLVFWCFHNPTPT